MHGVLIIAVSLVVLFLSAVGISMLEVENSFIDYFKKSTEIYKGMKVIDQKLGGTTPFDVIVDLEGPKEEAFTPITGTKDAQDEVFDESLCLVLRDQ